MNIEQLQAKREGFLASARELAAGDGDLAQVKSLMAEAKNIEERIETIKSLGVTAPVASAPVEDKPWKSGGVSKRITDLLPGDTAEERNYKAYQWGQWARSIMGNRKAADWVKNHIKANEGTDRAVCAQRYGLAAVAVMRKWHFEACNGYSNTYWGWGYEDTDLAKRLESVGIPLGYKDGTFIALDHDSNGYDANGEVSRSCSTTCCHNRTFSSKSRFRNICRYCKRSKR